MKKEITEILNQPNTTVEQKTDAIFNIASTVNQATVIQMQLFTEWAADNFVHLKGFWIPKAKGKERYRTNDLLTAWIKLRGLKG